MKLEDAARALGPPGRLSRIEKDAILARVEAGRAGWYRRRRVQVGAAALALTVAAATLFVVRPHETPAELTARGVEKVTLVIRCGDRAPGDCRMGDRIVFDFGSAAPSGYVALFARSRAGDVIWYLPGDESQPSIALATNAPSGVLDTVAVIDDSYTPGRYELFAVISRQPLSRADIRGFARGDQLVPSAGVHIETRAFDIRGKDSSP